MFLARLASRNCQPEIMDEPNLPAPLHQAALRGLARINRLSASDAILWRPLRALAREDSTRRLRVLDVACGGGDVPIRLWQRARRDGIALDIHGVDVSPTAVAQAQANARQAGADVEFSRADVLGGPLPAGFDVITSSLFLHHLQQSEALELLRKMRASAGTLVLVNDLIRSRTGYLLAYLGTRVLSRCHVVHFDGPRSVEAAFTPEEARLLAEQAGLDGIRTSRHWPWRFLLQWRRS